MACDARRDGTAALNAVAAADQGPATPTATLGTLDGVAFVVGIVIGIGIFRTPQVVAANSASGTTFMLLWLLGAVLMLISAHCYAELGASRPHAGGEYHFLARAWGQPVATLFAWARGDTPVNALWLQAAIALVLVAFGSLARDGFTATVEYTAPVFWLFLLLIALSLFVLRRREPQRELPFRVPLYPLTPALFVATCTWMLWSSLAYTGRGALLGVAVLALGLPLLWLARRAPRPD